MALTTAPPDLESELAKGFLAEYDVHLNAIRADLLAIAKGGVEPGGDTGKQVLRAIHALRGSAFLGLTKVGELAHQMEKAWVRIAAAKAAPRPFELRGLLLGVEKAQLLLQNPGSSNDADIGGPLAALTGILRNDSSAKPEASARRDDLLGGKALRSLVVDDSPPNIAMLKAFLGRFGTCDAAANGREGVEACRGAIGRGEGYDFICMDLIMPETSGREALQQIRKLEEETGILPEAGAKVIMMTAVDDLGEVIRCFQDFSDGYLTKPVNLATLLRQMKSWELIP